MHSLQQLQSGQLANSTHLKIAEGLTHFPEAILTLADTLEILDLSGNQLDSLPANFGCLQQLKILFLSDNRFSELPRVLADCPQLEMIGFKANQIHTVPERALPLRTRWLILTDNRIAALPDSIGELSRLQKLMLAGNQIQRLPASLGQCQNLQLLRISANQLTHLPDWLLDMPHLAWLAFAGNPLTASSLPPSAPISIPAHTLAEFELHEPLGQGASGVIYRATARTQPLEAATSDTGKASAVAIKLFKKHVTSDGYPADELLACLQAGSHPNLVEVIAQINDAEQQGLVMELIPPHFTNLGQPPTYTSCTRDVFTQGQQLSAAQALHIARQMIDTLRHLHSRQISHGDLYAHNILIDADGKVLFGDFGAASSLSALSIGQRRRVEKIERRALGHLLEDLLGLVSDPNAGDHYPDLLALSGEYRDEYPD